MTLDPYHVPGSATSEAAAETIKPLACRLRLAVLRAIAHPNYHLGITDEQAQRMTGLEGNCQRPRRRELVTLGWIRDSGTTRPTKSGRQAKVWTVTNEGRAILDGVLHG